MRSADVAKGVKVLTKQQSRAIEAVEKLLLIWINEKQLASDSVLEAVICEQAEMLCADLLNDRLSAERDLFKTSGGGSINVQPVVMILISQLFSSLSRKFLRGH